MKRMLLVLAGFLGTAVGHAAGQPFSLAIQPYVKLIKHPKLYYSTDTVFDYDVYLISDDDKSRHYVLSAYRYKGKKYINGISIKLPLDLSDEKNIGAGIQLYGTSIARCLNLSESEYSLITNWQIDKMQNGMATNGGRYTKDFGKYNAQLIVNTTSYPTSVQYAIFRTDGLAGASSWANFCTVEGRLVY